MEIMHRKKSGDKSIIIVHAKEWFPEYGSVSYIYRENFLVVASCFIYDERLIGETIEGKETLAIVANETLALVVFNSIEPVNHLEENLALKFTCPQCKLTSYHPEDVKQRYCGNCGKFFPEDKVVAEFEVRKTVK